MICPKCGNQLPDGAGFCNICGAIFNNQPPVQPDQPTVQLDQPPMQPPVQAPPAQAYQPPVQPPVQAYQPPVQPPVQEQPPVQAYQPPVQPPVQAYQPPVQPPMQAYQPPMPDTPQKKKFPKWGITLIIVGVIAVIAAIILALSLSEGSGGSAGSGSKSKKDKKESSQTAEKEEELSPGSWTIVNDSAAEDAFGDMVTEMLADGDAEMEAILDEIGTDKISGAIVKMMQSYTFVFTDDDEYYMLLDPDGFRESYKDVFKSILNGVSDMGIEGYCDLFDYNVEDIEAGLTAKGVTWEKLWEQQIDEYCDLVDEEFSDEKIAIEAGGELNDDGLVEVKGGTYEYDEDDEILTLYNASGDSCEIEISYKKGIVTIEGISGEYDESLDILDYLEGAHFEKK